MYCETDIHKMPLKLDWLGTISWVVRDLKETAISPLKYRVHRNKWLLERLPAG
jgi:hypothetical protein